MTEWRAPFFFHEPRDTSSKESVSEYREFVQLRLRKRVLEAIEVVLEEEVDQALGCRSYERAEDRRGYRNGAETRRVTTSVGTRELRVPRARVRDEETGETTEFRSELLPRYARRTREVDEAILGTYLSGANSPGHIRNCVPESLLILIV